MNCLLSILFAGILLCGSLGKMQPANDGSSVPKNLEIRNNAARLLYELLGDEQNVSKNLIVKRNSEELGQFIKAISAAASTDEKQLERLAKNNSSLNLRAIQLPQGEKTTREAVSKTVEHELLFSSGKELEFNLLLTQAEALSYGWHLAKNRGGKFVVDGGGSNIYSNEPENGKFIRPGRLANAAKKIK